MIELKKEAIDALHNGRAIEAIKITRKATGLGLKEAKEMVDGYLLQHPELKAQMPKISQEATFHFYIILAGAALLLWFFFK